MTDYITEFEKELARLPMIRKTINTFERIPGFAYYIKFQYRCKDIFIRLKPVSYKDYPDNYVELHKMWNINNKLDLAITPYVVRKKITNELFKHDFLYEAIAINESKQEQRYALCPKDYADASNMRVLIQILKKQGEH